MDRTERRISTALLTEVAVGLAVALLIAGVSGRALAASFADGLARSGVEQLLACLGLLLAGAVGLLVLSRLRLRDALQRSEQRFRSIAEASISGLLQFSADGRLLFANRRWTELTGGAMTADSRNWLEALAADERGPVLTAWRQVCVDGVPFATAVHFLRGDASQGMGELTIHPELSAAGSVVRLVVRLVDQTDRIHAQQALAEREEQYRILAENSSDLVLRLTNDGTIRFASQSAETLLRRKPAQMLGLSLCSIIHPDDWEAVSRALMAQTPKPGDLLSFRVQRVDRIYCWVEAQLRAIDGQGGETEWIASLRDITLRRKAELAAASVEAKLRETNRLLSLAEELATVGHWRADAASAEVTFSSEALVLLGLQTPLRSFREALNLIDPRDRLRLLRAVNRALHQDEPSECQLHLMRGDGKVRIFQLRLQADRSGRGRWLVMGMFGVITDITDKLAAEAALLAALEEARAAADAKAAFLATMSHEIRTPMTGVLGMIELLRARPTEQEQQRYLETLKQSAALLMTVLNDVLDFSRLDSGRIDLSVVPFDLAHMLRSTVALFDKAATSKGLLLNLDWQGPPDAWVAGDPMRLQQIVSNLICNAVKFTEAGSVTVKAGLKDGRRGRQRWRIEVCDQGIGIGPADQQRLFEPFMQADASAGRRFGGTGLGLAISRRLVEGMRGAIGCCSTLGEGATFWVELPLPAAEPVVAVALPAPVKPRGAAGRRLAVLVAEDNPVNQLLIQALLRQMGHQPTCVGDGRAAVEAARARRFDCILMDMQMPELDGVSAAREIRGAPGASAAVPIIALTADATPQRRSAYLVEAIDQVLTKPLDPSSLADVLGKVALGQPLAAAHAPVSRPPLDREQLHEIRSALGEERTANLLALFVQELAVRPGIIRAAVGRSDLAAAASEAHSLKGAALSMGGRAVGQAAARLERLLSTTGGEGGQALHRALRELDQAVATTVAALPPDRTAKPQQAA